MSKWNRWLRRRSLTRYRFLFFVRLALTSLPFVILSVGLIFVAMSTQASIVTEWKEVFLVFGTGVITLTAAYVGAAMEHYREKERELRQTRRNRVQIYRNYLMKVMALMQRVELAADFQGKGAVTQYKWIEVTETDREEMLKTLPPIYEFSTIDDDYCREGVDEAIWLGLQYWNRNVPDGQQPDINELQNAFRYALQQLDHYENLL
jgi:hypothetical protein